MQFIIAKQSIQKLINLHFVTNFGVSIDNKVLVNEMEKGKCSPEAALGGLTKRELAVLLQYLDMSCKKVNGLPYKQDY